MKIHRRGARRDHGWTTLVEGARPKVSFEADQNELFLHVDYQRARPVWGSYEYKNGSYNFRVNLTLEDIGDLIAKLSKDGTTHAPSELRDALRPHLASLLKLIACAQGFTLKRIRKSKAAGDESSPAGDPTK